MRRKFWSLDSHFSVDYNLQPNVKEIPSYVKDKKYFVKKRNRRNTRRQFTFPNNERTKAVKEAYDKHHNKTVSTKVITTFLSLSFFLNNFIFNSLNYI